MANFGTVSEFLSPVRIAGSVRTNIELDLFRIEESHSLVPAKKSWATGSMLIWYDLRFYLAAMNNAYLKPLHLKPTDSSCPS